MPPHRTLAELEAGLLTSAPAPKDAGTLSLIVARRAAGVHEALPSARLTPEEGLPGDKWLQGAAPKFDNQLTVMRRDVAELIAHGRDLSLFGDNLFVDLDLSADNLPLGARVQVGSAIVEVTPMPHNGCLLFKERFGGDALRFVAAPATRRQNLRGIHWKVVVPGLVEAGAAVRVLSR